MSSTLPLIIDTDVALGVEHDGRPRDIDDAFALVESINAADIDLLGVTCVYGNAPHESVYQVARDIVTLKGADIPVLPGADRALPAAGTLPPPNEAVEFLASTLRAGPAHIAAIGPLTNLGLLAHHHPDVLSNVASVIAVAGRSEDAPFYLGDAGPVRDFNFENDVRAARLLLEAGVPVVLAGFELTSQVAVTADDLEAIRRVGTPTADYFHRNSLAWCGHWTRTFPVDAGFHPWDSAAIAWLRHPEYFVTEQRGWRIREVSGNFEGSVGATSVGATSVGATSVGATSVGATSVGATFQSRPKGRSHHTGSRLESRSYWLECDPEYPGDRVTYCTGFAPGGREAFVRDVVTTVY